MVAQAETNVTVRREGVSENRKLTMTMMLELLEGFPQYLKKKYYYYPWKNMSRV